MIDEWSLSSIEKEDGSLLVIRKNLHPLPEGKGRSDYPVCLYFTVHYHPHTADGFPCPEDNDSFEKLESQIENLCNGSHSIFTATVFMPKIKDFILYTADPHSLSKQLECMSTAYSNFRFECGGTNDEKWSQYEVFN